MKLQGYAPLLNRCPNLLVLSTNGAGYDTVSLTDATAAGVAVVNQAGGNKEGVAEHVMAMMLTLSKRLVMSDHAMRGGGAYDRRDFMGDDVQGRTIGVIGLGHVGTRVAELCRGLFQMRVIAYDPYLTTGQIAAKGAEKALTLEDLLRAADYVSVNCPHTAETRGMMGAAQFAAMQKHAYFITTARGGIHDEAALAAALSAKQIAGAGLDVWEDEPPPSDHPFTSFRQRCGQPAYRRDYSAVTPHHRQDRRGADDRHPGRQETSAPAESGGVAELCRAVQPDFGLPAGGLKVRASVNYCSGKSPKAGYRFGLVPPTGSFHVGRRPIPSRRNVNPSRRVGIRFCLARRRPPTRRAYRHG